MKSKNIKVYDNGGKTMDRYTVVYLNDKQGIVSNNGGSMLFGCVGMNETPLAPNGFCQHSTCLDGKHLGKKIAFKNLPVDCQEIVLIDLKSFKETRRLIDNNYENLIRN